ncbi:hypothetical protein ANCCAN_01069 [Ancylostoma caninum]|uniref:Uncharacterized protein n=1 Tax=Ancylostoma caninum TaxID=29170 RepID=A0A368H7W1_ANCCA|nr:hypothetical protein ANCCAN_01069 [Ancylostoma caninum]
MTDEKTALPLRKISLILVRKKSIPCACIVIAEYTWCSA